MKLKKYRILIFLGAVSLIGFMLLFYGWLQAQQPAQESYLADSIVKSYSANSDALVEVMIDGCVVIITRTIPDLCEKNPKSSPYQETTISLSEFRPPRYWHVFGDRILLPFTDEVSNALTEVESLYYGKVIDFDGSESLLRESGIIYRPYLMDCSGDEHFSFITSRAFYLRFDIESFGSERAFLKGLAKMQSQCLRQESR